MTPIGNYDVVIVGAGLVGGALACALSDSPLKVAIIEPREMETEWPPADDGVAGFDARVSAITAASQQWLESLGAWPGMFGQRGCPYTRMQVWDAEGTGSISFDAAEVNQPALGHIVENRLIVCALMRRLQASTNVRQLTPARVTALQPFEGGYRLTLDQGAEIETGLVVAADGAMSQIRTLTGFSLREWDYGHRAIVATVESERGHEHTAWQRFLPEGPLAFLPLCDRAGEQRLCSIVWSAVPDYAEALMALSDAEFCEQLGAAFELRLGRVQAVGQRFCFPLRQRHAVDYVQSGIALVGDAAHTIHPLAGQGVNLGLMDAKVCAQELLRATAAGLNPGHLSVLQRYQRRRKGDNLTMMAGMEVFKRLFEQDHLWVRWARNTGMRWLDKNTGAKRRIIRQAMGLEGVSVS